MLETQLSVIRAKIPSLLVSYLNKDSSNGHGRQNQPTQIIYIYILDFIHLFDREHKQREWEREKMRGSIPGP